MSGVRENLVLVCVSLSVFLTQPAIVRAQETNYNPLDFTEPLKLSRGELKPLGSGSIYLSRAESCQFAKQEWGWGDCDGLAYLIVDPVPGLDIAAVTDPTSDGYVKLEDWAESEKEVDAIWEAYVEGLKAQSRNTGLQLEPIGWHMKPTVVTNPAYLYYSTALKWNGERTINSKATLFDRYGNVTVMLVPTDSNISPEEMQRLTQTFLGSYTSTPGTEYTAFTAGDKVAAGGAVGVLATLLGVKYGKAATAGVFAVVLAFAKKLWFLIIAVPAIIWRWLRGKQE